MSDDLAEGELQRAAAAGGPVVVAIYCEECAGMEGPEALARVRRTPLGLLYEKRGERVPQELRGQIPAVARSYYVPVALIDETPQWWRPESDLRCWRHGYAFLDPYVLRSEVRPVGTVRVLVKCRPAS